MKRILVGNESWAFLLDVLLRTAVLYVLLVVAMRLLGKRLSGQMTILEMGVMITIGAIVSAPMVDPGRGILVGALLLATLLGLHRIVGRLGVASNRFERIAQGDTTMVVADGRIVIEALARSSLSRNVLFASLRKEGLFHLGQVERVYIEACGLYSIVEYEKPKPGLCLYPDAPREQIARIHEAKGQKACRRCGHVAEREERCARCGDTSWSVAVEIA